MDIKLEPGKYVVAVSGGVDSMVLLDLMSSLPGLELIVAHFDHGIREDSGLDREFVGQSAKKYGLKFEAEQGKLGAKASEETARNARYAFLKKVQKEHEADAIVTAHHEDDLLETATINILRGTGPKGLTSLASKPELIRPLLGFSKSQIREYAQSQNIKWREDPTNKDTVYLRNYVRHMVLSKLTESQRKEMLAIIEGSVVGNAEINELIKNLQFSSPIDRRRYLQLPYSVSKEVLTELLRDNRISFDSKTIERLAVELKTKPLKSKLEISGGWYFLVEKQQISLHHSK